MKIIKAKEIHFPLVRAFYHSLIDNMQSSPYKIGWIKDIYPAPDFLLQSIRNGELYLGIEDNSSRNAENDILPESGDEVSLNGIAAAMVINHEYNESYNNFHWQTVAEDSEILIIHALGVHPDYAGRGCAKQMVRTVVDIGKSTGMKAIRLDVLGGNIPAENLYTELGFKYLHTLQMFYEDTGWTNFKLYEYVL